MLPRGAPAAKMEIYCLAPNESGACVRACKQGGYLTIYCEGIVLGLPRREGRP